MRLCFEQRVAATSAELFAFHEDPARLVALLEGWPCSRVVSHPGHIRPGARLEIEERLGPLRLRLLFEHQRYEPPHLFSERLVRGAFAEFHHVHEFLPDGGGAIVRDTLDLALPWWLGGALATRLVVAPRTRRFFAHRHAALECFVAEGRVRACR